MRKKLTTEEFITRSNVIHNNKYGYSKVQYIGSQIKVVITCPIHGDFEQKPNKHLQKQGCPKCINNIKDTKESFIQKAIKIHGDKYDYSLVDYINANLKVDIICKLDNYIFSQTPGNHISGKGCPKCSNHLVLGIENFIKRSNSIHNYKYDYSKSIYIDTNTKLKIHCNICNNSFEQTPRNHFAGQGCPKCLMKGQTKLYNNLKDLFTLEIIEWEYSPDWLGRQRFDIYFIEHNIAIEYNGKQHYESVEFFGGDVKFKNQQERDTLKKDKCLNNNCLLLELKYDYTNMDFLNLCKIIKDKINTGLIEKLTDNED